MLKFYIVTWNSFCQKNAKPPLLPLLSSTNKLSKPNLAFIVSNLLACSLVSIKKTMLGLFSFTNHGQQRFQTVRGFLISSQFQLKIFIMHGGADQQPLPLWFLCLQLSSFLFSQGQHLPQNSPLDSSGFFFLSFYETPVELETRSAPASCFHVEIVPGETWLLVVGKDAPVWYWEVSGVRVGLVSKSP